MSEELTKRNRQVLELAAAGLTSAETGERLGISGRTVEIFRAQAIKRLGGKNLPHAVWLYQDRLRTEALNDLFYIWSGEHNAYWRSKGNGYTVRISRAGVFAREDAEAILRGIGPEKRLEMEPVLDAVIEIHKGLPLAVRL